MLEWISPFRVTHTLHFTLISCYSVTLHCKSETGANCAELGPNKTRTAQFEGKERLDWQDSKSTVCCTRSICSLSVAQQFRIQNRLCWECTRKEKHKENKHLGCMFQRETETFAVPPTSRQRKLEATQVILLQVMNHKIPCFCVNRSWSQWRLCQGAADLLRCAMVSWLSFTHSVAGSSNAGRQTCIWRQSRLNVQGERKKKKGRRSFVYRRHPSKWLRIKWLLSVPPAV